MQSLVRLSSSATLDQEVKQSEPDPRQIESAPFEPGFELAFINLKSTTTQMSRPAPRSLSEVLRRGYAMLFLTTSPHPRRSRHTV
jgi:hypothetical protein